jgi:hypothetical protein
MPAVTFSDEILQCIFYDDLDLCSFTAGFLAMWPKIWPPGNSACFVNFSGGLLVESRETA